MNNRLIGLAALASAGLASICCIGPLILAGLGLGSLGLAAGLTKYRLEFLILTAAILTVGFYYAYRKRRVDCADGSCELRSGSGAMKSGLWAVTILAAALATFPNWSARVLSVSSDAVPAGAEVLSLKIAGMDCAACTVEIKKSVEKVPGVLSADIDFSRQSARIVTNGKADRNAVLGAVTASGYKAKLIDGGSNGKPRS